MSQGKVIVLDTADNIKDQFGVGYKLIIEQRQDQEEPEALPVERIDEKVLSYGNYEKEVRLIKTDSSNLRRVFNVPMQNNACMGEVLRDIENTFPHLLAALEITSLEDAYLKIVQAEGRMNRLGDAE